MFISKVGNMKNNTINKLNWLVIVSFGFVFIILSILITSKYISIYKAKDLYQSTPEEINSYYNSKVFLKPEKGIFVPFNGADNYYLMLKENLKDNEYIIINSVFEPKKFIYLEKHSELLKNNNKLPVLNRGIRQLKNFENVKNLPNFYYGDYFAFSFFTYNEISTGNLVFEHDESKQNKVLNDKERNQLFIIFHEIMHSHTLQNILEGLLLDNNNKHNKIYYSQIKEAHSDLSSILAIAKLYDLSFNQFKQHFEELKKFRYAYNTYRNVDLTSHDVKQSLLLFENELSKENYDKIKTLSFKAIPYFVFDIIKGIPYSSDAYFLNERTSHCLEIKNCTPAEVEYLIYGLYRYIPEEKNFEKTGLPEFENRYDMMNSFYELSKDVLLKEKEEIYDSVVKENLFIRKHQLSFENLLKKYENFN